MKTETAMIRAKIKKLPDGRKQILPPRRKNIQTEGTGLGPMDVEVFFAKTAHTQFADKETYKHK